jgi:hypothetical protein
MGFFTVPVIERKPWGILILVMNILPWPVGIGTMMAAAHERNWKMFVLGVLMMVVFVVGWIYSIIWGIMVLIKGTSTTAAPPAPATPAKATKGRAKKA